MTFFDAWGQIFSAVFTTILAFSPAVVHLVSRTTSDGNPPSSIFSSFDDIVREELHADARYQQASVGGAVPSEASATSTPIEDALVNVFCTARGEHSVRTITGSGVFIDERGIILTNAHIAQFLLLPKDDPQVATRCVIRQGSPAISKYEAELLYISPAWIEKNASQLSLDHPLGTGEDDFALLSVTDAFEGDVPERFPALSPATSTDLYTAMAVAAAGYPADLLTPDNVQAPLVPIVATTTVSTLFTFDEKEIDLLTIAPSNVGRQGSSGGPVVDEDGAVIGLIATRGNSAEEGAQSLRALTLSYIDRILYRETGLDLAHTLAGDIGLRARVFRETIAPHLRELLLGLPQK
jgi:hypothetical protein